MLKGVSKTLKLNSCGTIPRCCFAFAKSLSISTPKIDTLPPVLFTNEHKIPIVVDLPAPFGPSKAKKSPFFNL